MFRIAVCDDEESERNAINRVLQAYLQARPELNAQISLFSTGYALLDELDRGPDFDIYILDILMPRMDGITLGRQLRENQLDGEILYLTTSRDYAIDSYEVNALHYLVKPVEKSKLFSVLDRALESHSTRLLKSCTVNTPDGLRRISMDSILYVEQASRAPHYHLSTGEAVSGSTLREPFLTALQALLEEGRFFACGSSYVLNFQRVQGFSRGDAQFTNGSRLRIPKSLLPGTKKAWIEYWLKAGVRSEV